MKIPGYRSLTTRHDWGRLVGDVNGHTDDHHTDVPVLILETDQGLEGVGLGAHAEIDRVFPAIEGEDPRAVTALYDRMIARVFKSGHGGSVFGAIGALDMALWDLKAKMADEPLWRTLGARDRFVPAYASGLDIALDDDQLADLYADFADHGFTAGKLKGGRDVEHDLRRLLVVREQLMSNSNRPALMFDANESWNRSQAARFVGELERTLDLTWIEEPVRRWDAAGLASVRRSVRAAVATGENLTGLEQFRPLLDADAVDVLQPAAVWGITHFLRVAAVAHGRDLPVSPVGYNGNPTAHAAASVPNHLASEVQDLTFPIGLDIDQRIEEGGIVLGDRPGLGIVVDEERIGSLTAEGSWATEGGPHVRPSRAGLRLIPDDARPAASRSRAGTGLPSPA